MAEAHLNNWRKKKGGNAENRGWKKKGKETKEKERETSRLWGKESARNLQLKVIVEQRSENLKTLNSQREVTKLTNDQLSIIIKVQFGFSL